MEKICYLCSGIYIIGFIFNMHNMKRFFIATIFAAAFVCTTAMAQQPEQNTQQKDQPHKEKMDQPRHDHAHQNCPHHAEPGQTACQHEGQPAQHKCSHEGQPGHQCGHACGEGTPETFRPHGKAIINLFQHVGLTYNNGEWSPNGFQMERCYLGYQYNLNPHWKATVIFDAAEGNTTGSIEHVFVKNAYVEYKHKGLAVCAGIVPTINDMLAEKVWGLRYVGRTMFDLYNYGNMADLGFTVRYDVCSWFSADVSMLNGEGFRKIQLDDHYQYVLGLDFRPLKGLSVRLSGDIHPYDDPADPGSITSRSDLHLSAGYDHRLFRLGADYNRAILDGGSDACDGISAYAIGKLNPKLDLYLRYDNGTKMANTLTYATDDDVESLMIGVDYKINKMVAVSPTLQYQVTNTSTTTDKSLCAYLSCKVIL